MNIFQIGYGKMGKLICRALKENRRNCALTVYDLCFEQSFEQDGVKFIENISACNLAEFDCAFISTPATSHCDIFKLLIAAGIKNIYVEKPAVMNAKEFDEICPISANCKIVSGYILRQSEPMFAMRHILNKMITEGFQMELCSVVYQKHLPLSAEARAAGDIGVFEEVVHIWDLLFNYLDFKTATCKILDKTLKSDSQRADRTIYAQLSYYLKFPHFNTLVQITSSFEATERKRAFFFSFRDVDGNLRHIYLSFDNADGFDRLTVTDPSGRIWYDSQLYQFAKL